MRCFGLCVCLALLGACGRPEPQGLLTPEPVSLGQPTAEAQAAQVAVLARQVRTYPEFGDDDPVAWARRAPQTYPVHGIDASRWQQNIDWPVARRAGVNFAFLKATEGGDLADPMFDTHRRGAEAAGVPWGAYHYYYFCRSAESQARWFIRNVPKGAPLPHVLDMEWTPRSRTCRHRPPGDEVRREADRFLDMLERHYGRRPVVYTTVDFYRDTGIGGLRGTEFWLRSVAAHPSESYRGAYWMFWQYSGTGRVPGIEGPVDLNVFRGTPEAWVRWRDAL